MSANNESRGNKHMILDDRKIKILHAIIKNYLETGEPVGSRTISKYTDLNLSSATIRNEMADLEEMGYIVQPHTSAGRIPSDKGYRLYVDTLMEEKDKEIEELKEVIIEKEAKVDKVLMNVAKVLASNTNYATMISAPAVASNKIKFLQLSRIDQRQILAVVVAEGNVIKNNVISVSEELTDETLLKLNLLLNTNLCGKAIEEINLPMITAMKLQAGSHQDVVSEVIDALAEQINVEEDLQIYTSGATNIFKYPELSDNQKASDIIHTLEEKHQLTSFITDGQADEDKNGIQVYIGDEAPIQSMKDCSIVTATYDLGDGLRGTIGIVGPKRMDYDKVVNTLKNITHQLDDLYKK